MKNFFQGWYFKCTMNMETIAFIPAIHHDGTKKSASLQVITNDETFSIPYETIWFDQTLSAIRIGNNIFSPKIIHLDVRTSNLHLTGTLKLSRHETIAYDIMGPFQYVPFMQCQHKIYSMSHQIDGNIICNNYNYFFHKGIGYLEGDRGYSFPKEYAWTHCHFSNGSLMLSVAHIPMLFFQFTGIISIILIDKKEYRLASYLGAKVKYIDDNTIHISQQNYRLSVKLLYKKDSLLYAPKNGTMARLIRESPVCTAHYRFTCKDKLLLDLISDMASFEYEYKTHFKS